jgi:hypothetical protein
MSRGPGTAQSYAFEVLWWVAERKPAMWVPARFIAQMRRNRVSARDAASTAAERSGVDLLRARWTVRGGAAEAATTSDVESIRRALHALEANSHAELRTQVHGKALLARLGRGRIAEQRFGGGRDPQMELRRRRRPPA